MRHFIFATAGHIDHGKTTLIKTLTGKDTDRLPEEKRRGLSIDIGFSYLDFPEDGISVELIDVPGHERFIKNAIAGMAGAKVLLLAVDALEGIKKQTEEHLLVASSIGIKEIIGVITKADRANKELLRKRKQELEKRLRSLGFSFRVVEFSPLIKETWQRVISAVRELALTLEPYPDDGPLRIHIDSAFTVKGFGTVLRGSMVSGTLCEGERVIIEPLHTEGRVRKIQNHGRFIKEAHAGQRVALNIPDLEPSQIKRGFWVLREGEYVRSERIIIYAGNMMESGGIYSLFIGMNEVQGRVKKAADGIYLFSAQRELVAFRSDRVLIINSQGRPIGAGEVLHPCPRNLHRKFIRENRDLLISDLDMYLEREKSKNTKTLTIEDRINKRMVADLIDLTSKEIKEEREILEKGIEKDTIRHCVRNRLVHRLGTSFLISDSLLREYIELLRSSGDTLSIHDVRKILGLTRKYIIPLLEYLDYLGLTVREGNYRRWKKGRG